jgi:undecaprenyl-diphosphatase
MGTRRRELIAAAWIVAAFAVILGLLIAAGHLLADVERRDGSTAFDASITNWVVAHRTGAATALARTFSFVGSQKVLTPVALTVAAALLLRRRFVPAVLLVVVWGGAILLYSLGKAHVGRPRPPKDLWLTHAGANAFPSGHALQSMATFSALAVVAAAALPAVHRRPALAVAVLLSLGVGWSRVYLGVHWTTDVLAGWLAGAAWVAAVIAAGRRPASR